MTISDLDKKLDKALSDFMNEIKVTFEEESQEPATINDVHWAARHVFYTLSEFKDQIIKYLKDL